MDDTSLSITPSHSIFCKWNPEPAKCPEIATYQRCKSWHICLFEGVILGDIQRNDLKTDPSRFDSSSRILYKQDHQQLRLKFNRIQLTIFNYIFLSVVSYLLRDFYKNFRNYLVKHDKKITFAVRDEKAMVTRRWRHPCCLRWRAHVFTVFVQKSTNASLLGPSLFCTYILQWTKWK